MMEAMATVIIWGAIVATLFCLQDFVKYVRDRYF